MILRRCFQCPVADIVWGCLQILQFVLIVVLCALALCVVVAELQNGYFKGNGTSSDVDLNPEAAFRVHELRDYFLRELEDAYENYPREITSPPIFRQRREKSLPVCDFDLFTNKEEEEEGVCSYTGGKPELDRSTITNVPSPFEDWDVELCGPVQLDHTVFRAGAGQPVFQGAQRHFSAEGHVLLLPVPPKSEQVQKRVRRQESTKEGEEHTHAHEEGHHEHGSTEEGGHTHDEGHHEHGSTEEGGHTHTHEEGHHEHGSTEEGGHTHTHDEHHEHGSTEEGGHTHDEEHHEHGSTEEGHEGEKIITDTPPSAFTEKCVLTPVRKWFKHHITNETVMIALDMLLHSEGTVKQVQAGFHNFYKQHWWLHVGVKTLDDKFSLVVPSVTLQFLLVPVYLMILFYSFRHGFYRNTRQAISLTLSFICLILSITLIVLQLVCLAERWALIDSFAETLDLSERESADDKLVLIRNRFQSFQSVWYNGYVRLACTLTLAAVSYVYLISQPYPNPMPPLWQFLRALDTPCLMSVTLLLAMTAIAQSALGGHLFYYRDYVTSLKSTFDPHIHGKVPAHLSSYYIYQFIIITWFVPLLIGLVLGITDMAIRNFTRCSLVGGEILEFDYISDKSKAAPPDTTATGAVRIDMTASDLIATDPAPTDSPSPSTAEPSLSKTKRAETIVLID